MPLDELFLWSCTRDREQPCLHGAGRAPLVRNSFEPQQKPLKEVQEQGSEGEGLCVNEKSPNKSHSQPRGGYTREGNSSCLGLQQRAGTWCPLKSLADETSL